MSDIQNDGTEPRRRPPVSRRTFIGAGAVLATAAAIGGVELARADRHDRDGTTPGTPPPGAYAAVVRWPLRTGTEGWRPATGTSGTAVSADPQGWLVGSGSGEVGVESPTTSTNQPLNWSLSDRDTARRLSLTVRVDGTQPTYDVIVTMCWQQDGRVETADSATFTVPANLDVDLDTWWDCRGTAPSDVLTKVQGIRIRAKGGGPLAIRVRDVRQPPTTAPRGGATGMAAAFHATAPATLPRPDPQDAYQRAVLESLTRAIRWGTTNHRALHIGEWAWPKESGGDTGPTASDLAYATMAEQWMRTADAHALPFTPWGESAYWAGTAADGKTNYGSYPDASYYCSGDYTRANGLPRVVDARKPSASALEDHIGRVPGVPASINLVGMCFTYLKDKTQYSSTNIGQRGSDYFAENPDTVAYLHSRGYRMFRLPFRWDRVMRTPEADALDADEWGYVAEAISTILALPDTSVIVDQHSSAKYWISPDPTDRSVPATKYVVDDPSGRLTTDHMVHFWNLVSDQLRPHSDRLVYEITNEPNDSSPFVVRRYTQAVVSSLRSRGDTTFCLIPSYPFDNVNRAIAPENHPFPWIEDPAGTRQHAYTFHHYMDYDQSGTYALSYDRTLAKYQ